MSAGSKTEDSRSQVSSRNDNQLLEEDKFTGSSLSLSNDNEILSLNDSNNLKGPKIIITDPIKLPELRLTGPVVSKTDKNKKKRKKKRTENKLNAELPSIVVQDGADVTLQEQNESEKNNIENGDNDNDSKYKLEAKFFKMGKYIVSNIPTTFWPILNM